MVNRAAGAAVLGFRFTAQRRKKLAADTHGRTRTKAGRIKSQKNMWPRTHADGRRH